ncbi:hypothetical protein GCM10022419_010140 [Nonomuraea rosea]|uniref:Uncharacterized protein n=1 Tax=Nonomuraea rosea TaxID=638574 RepID=A0ABP6VDA6_9ACTN
MQRPDPSAQAAYTGEQLRARLGPVVEGGRPSSEPFRVHDQGNSHSASSGGPHVPGSVSGIPLPVVLRKAPRL